MMKMKWFLLVAMLLPLLGSAVEGYKLVCDEPTYNFGIIDQSTVVTNVFTVRNEGDLTCLVKNIYTSCGCTKGTISNSVIGPGETTQITVVFDGAGRRGIQKKTVTVVSGTSYEPALTLCLEGAVREIVATP